MFSSENVNNGFSAIEQKELENVNGGVFTEIGIGVLIIGGIFGGTIAITKAATSK
jgi:lactobin A/cerein 7B family class IIb bacteriocin